MMKKKTYQQPITCIEAFVLDTHITINATSGDSTDQQLVKGDDFGVNDESPKNEDDWSEVW